MLIDFIGALVLTAVSIVNVNLLIGAMPLSQRGRFVVMVAVGLWIGLQVALASAGAFASEFARFVPLIGLTVAIPPLATWLVARRSGSFRDALLAVPTPLLVGLNASRVFGAFFLILALQGRLGGPFPASAGWGDILTGALAIPLAIAAARGAASRTILLAWNVLGIVDLLTAVSLGILSAEGTPIQVFHAGAGSIAVTALPWSLIPTVLVPFYLVVHGVI